MKACVWLNLILCSFAQAAVYTVPKGDVEFTAIGNPKKLVIIGTTQSLTGNLSRNKNLLAGEVIVDLSTLKTGMDRRDDHMKNKYLEVEKFKNATLQLDSIDVKSADAKLNLPGQAFTGKLNLHGVEKSVSGVAKLNFQDGKILVDASFGINTNDFNIKTPSFAGLTVAEAVSVHVVFEAMSEIPAKN